MNWLFTDMKGERGATKMDEGNNSKKTTLSEIDFSAWKKRLLDRDSKTLTDFYYEAQKHFISVFTLAGRNREDSYDYFEDSYLEFLETIQKNLPIIEDWTTKKKIQKYIIGIGFNKYRRRNRDLLFSELLGSAEWTEEDLVDLLQHCTADTETQVKIRLDRLAKEVEIEEKLSLIEGTVMELIPNPMHREIFFQFYLSAPTLTAAEIAQRHQTTEANVRQVLYRIRQQIAARFTSGSAANALCQSCASVASEKE